jgi:hypothetical protein
MDLASHKWLHRLIEQFKKDYKENYSDLRHLYICDTEGTNFLYKTLHITGLLFGHPTKPLFSNHIEFEEWPNNEKMKYIFTELLYHLYFFENKKELLVTDDKSVDLLFEKATNHILAFFLKYAPDEDENGVFNFLALFSKKDDNYLQLEKILDKRINFILMTHMKYWTGASYNTFIFLDLVYYNLSMDNPSKQYYRKHEAVQLQILKIIIAAFLSKEVLLFKDRNILNYFLSSAIVSESSQKRITRYLEKGLTLDEMQFSNTLHPIFNLIFLEIGIIAVLSDRYKKEVDQQFIANLAEKLEIDSDTLENSYLMVESFMDKNGSEVLYLKEKHKLNLFSSSVNQRLLSMIKKNKAKIIREISESKELVELLLKAQNTQLSKEEKDKVKEQISDLLRTIPSLTIFMIPGGSLLLPVLYKILPEELLKPSSFRN